MTCKRLQESNLPVTAESEIAREAVRRGIVANPSLAIPRIVPQRSDINALISLATAPEFPL
jgi:hypothetical protein